MTLEVGANSIGLSNRPVENETLPPSLLPRDTDEQIAYLLTKVDELNEIVAGKADADSLRTLLAYSDETLLLQAKDIVLVGDVTIANIINEQNGSTTGTVDATITRIIGDRIQTGTITSNNWGASQGTAIDLDNETLYLGGSADPDFFYDGAGNLDLRGTLTVGSIIETGVTVGGTSLGTISSNAAAGYGIQQQLEVSGATILAGTIEPQNTGGIKAGTITWNSSTGELTGGSGTAMTEAGFIGAQSGTATFTIVASTGAATYAGDVSTAGQMLAEGTTSAGGVNAAIVGRAVSPNSSVIAIAAIKDATATADTFFASAAANTNAVQATNSGTGNALSGTSTNASGSALALNNSGGGSEITLTNGIITGDATFEDDVTIERTLHVDLAVTMDSTLTVLGRINADDDMTIDKTLYVATDGTSGDSSVVIGSGSGHTGQNTLVLKSGAAGSRVSGEWHLFGEESADGDTTFAMVLDQGVTTGTSPSPTHRIPIIINSVEYWLYLESR